MYGAGDGNRTHDISLEGWSFTIKLHPQIEFFQQQNLYYQMIRQKSTYILMNFYFYPKQKSRKKQHNLFRLFTFVIKNSA
jgi:hypothetical protein